MDDDKLIWFLNDYNASENCSWVHLFSNEERETYNKGLVTICWVSAFAIFWLHLTIANSYLRNDLNYSCLMMTTMSASLRRFQLGLSRLFFIQTMQSTCVLFAYVDSLLGLLEIESLTHTCIARFVLARYAAKGWRVPKNLWDYFLLNALAFSAFYTFLPLTGYGGSYVEDFTCTACTYNVILPNDTYERQWIILWFFLRYIKPVLMMFFMVIWAYYLEEYVCRDVVNAARKPVTSMMLEIIFVYVLLCGMAALTNICVIASQLMANDIIDSTFNGMWIQWSHWLHALWPLVAVIVMMVRDENIRRTMIHVLFCGRLCNEKRTEVRREIREVAPRNVEYDEDDLTCRRG